MEGRVSQVLSSNGFGSTIRDPSRSNAAAAAVVTARREERKRSVGSDNSHFYDIGCYQFVQRSQAFGNAGHIMQLPLRQALMAPNNSAIESQRIDSSLLCRIARICKLATAVMQTKTQLMEVGKNRKDFLFSRRMKEASWRVAGAWLLASACLVGHLPHWWQGAPAFLHRFASPRLHAALSAAALLGQPYLKASCLRQFQVQEP